MSGPFGSSQWMYNAGGDFYPYTIDQSLRFDAGGSSYLEKTFSATGNAKTFTISFWWKRNRTDTAEYLFAGGNDVNNRFHMDINASGTFQIEAKNGGSQVLKMEGGPVLRDVSAWYHFVLRVDTTQSTASDRVRLYKNGDLLTFNSNSYPSQNTDLNWNINDQVRIGRSGWDTNYFSGYMAEFINVDGQSLGPDSFGEVKSGIWIPSDYSGSYGTNGFKLAFQDSGALGDDTSGNGHDFTSSGLAAHDQMPDSPTNNFANFNSLPTTHDLSEGNLRVDCDNSTAAIPSTLLAASGKWYAEIRINDLAGSNTYVRIGVVTADGIGKDLGGVTGTFAFLGDGRTYSQGSVATYGTAVSTSDVFQVALDNDNGKLWFGINGTWMASGDPASGSNPSLTFTAGEQMGFAVASGSGGHSPDFTANFGQDSSFAGNETAQGNSDGNGQGDLYYTPPSGFLALCSANLPELAIDPANDETPEDYFNTLLYTGNGADGRALTGVGFQPDWTWIKSRSAARDHKITDSVRGVNKELGSQSSAAEVTRTNGLSAFGSDGFTVGSESGYNNSGDTLVAWNWKAGGTAVSNTDGSITSQVSANVDAGFSIVTWTGTSGSDTIGHGLGTAPAMIITKALSGDNWIVYHKDMGATKQVYLDLVNAQETNSNIYSVVPTSSVFTIGSWSSTRNFVSYCFADVEGYSKVGSYVGNGSTDGVFVNVGFRPSAIIAKNINDGTTNWWFHDDKRLGYNANNYALFPNLNQAEDANVRIDMLSNGFKLRNTAKHWNTSGQTFIYLAIAEQPFKYANAR